MTAPAHPQRCHKCVVSWCDFHCEIQASSIKDSPPTCGCIYNSDVGAIWECASHSSAQSRDQVLDEAYRLLKAERDEIFDGVGMDDIDYIFWKLRTQGSRDP